MKICFNLIYKIYNSSFYIGSNDLWNDWHFYINDYLYSNFKQLLYKNRFRKNMYLICG